MASWLCDSHSLLRPDASFAAGEDHGVVDDARAGGDDRSRLQAQIPPARLQSARWRSLSPRPKQFSRRACRSCQNGRPCPFRHGGRRSVDCHHRHDAGRTRDAAANPHRGVRCCRVPVPDHLTLERRHIAFQVPIADAGPCPPFGLRRFPVRPGPSRRPAFVDIDAEPSPLLPPAPAKQPPGDPLPHIIMVLHESTFDPRRFGLPVDDCFARFFSPTAGLSGTLNVEVFGGSSLQSEFSILTGLSTRSFGSDSRYVFHLLDGRIRHSLPLHLSAIGYSHAYLSCDSPSQPRQFLQIRRAHRCRLCRNPAAAIRRRALAA